MDNHLITNLRSLKHNTLKHWKIKSCVRLNKCEPGPTNNIHAISSSCVGLIESESGVTNKFSLSYPVSIVKIHPNVYNILPQCNIKQINPKTNEC